MKNVIFLLIAVTLGAIIISAALIVSAVLVLHRLPVDSVKCFDWTEVCHGAVTSIHLTTDALWVTNYSRKITFLFVVENISGCANATTFYNNSYVVLNTVRLDPPYINIIESPFKKLIEKEGWSVDWYFTPKANDFTLACMEISKGKQIQYSLPLEVNYTIVDSEGVEWLGLFQDRASITILGGEDAPSLKDKWEPRITYIDTLPVDPSKTEFTFGGGGYVNERCEYHYLVYTSWSAKRFQVMIESFSEELQVLAGNKRVETAPYVLQQGNLPEERCIWLSFTVIMPNQTGTYELDLRIRLFGWFFSREYKWTYTFGVEVFVPKPSPEELLIVILDKDIYHQGEIMTITIENISNETQWFGNAAYDVCFEMFNGEYWEFYDSIPGAEVITFLEPGKTGQVIWRLGGHTDHPFPAGQYRVWVHGVYVEFEVV